MSRLPYKNVEIYDQQGLESRTHNDCFHHQRIKVIVLCFALIESDEDVYTQCLHTSKQFQTVHVQILELCVSKESLSQ